VGKRLALVVALVAGLAVGVVYGGALVAVPAAILASLGAYKLRERLKKKSRFYRKYVLMEG